MSTLDVLPLGRPARVTAVLGEGDIPLRLLEMGFLPDVEVSVVKRAPLGDPLEVEVLGYRLVLRCSEASLIQIRPVPEAP